tara:strand:+ start:1221 stop:1328 length:108 start_codon:yes stop_codon:yes gene_type:complete
MIEKNGDQIMVDEIKLQKSKEGIKYSSAKKQWATA